MPRIENRVLRIIKNYHRVPTIREIGSLQVHTRCLTFFLLRTWFNYRCSLVIRLGLFYKESLRHIHWKVNLMIITHLVQYHIFSLNWLMNCCILSCGSPTLFSIHFNSHCGLLSFYWCGWYIVWSKKAPYFHFELIFVEIKFDENFFTKH